MKSRRFVIFFAMLLLAGLLANCNLPTNQNNLNNNQSSEPPTENPGLEWRSPNYTKWVSKDTFFNRVIELEPSDLCTLNLSLVEVTYPEAGKMSLIFQSSTGKIEPGQYAAYLDEADGLYTCQVSPTAESQLICTGAVLPPGSQTLVHLGEVAVAEFPNMYAEDGNQGFLLNKSTALDSSLNFQLAEQTADLMGMGARINSLADAYRILGTYVSLSGLPGYNQMEPARQLISAFPQYQKNGLVCDSYWDCANQCAAEVNYDLKSDDLIGAFNFYKDYISKLEFLLPDSCKAFNQYAKVVPPRAGTPQYVDYQWKVVSSDRFELYQPDVGVFDIYDTLETLPDRLFDLTTPAEVYTCAEDIGWPYDDLNDLSAFINYYFEYLLTQNYEFSSACISDQTRGWIRNATDRLRNDSSSADATIAACALEMQYAKQINVLADKIEFFEWLMNKWAHYPAGIPSACSALWASNAPTDVFSQIPQNFGGYYGIPPDPICTYEQTNELNQAIAQFNWETYSCGEQTECEYYDSECQEIAFRNSLVRDGTIEGPSTCKEAFPYGCLAYPSEEPFVPAEVWECAIDTCLVNTYPLQRGEGVYGLAQNLDRLYNSENYPLPASCSDIDVLHWVEQNKNCASEDYPNSDYTYESCGAPFQLYSDCITVYTEEGGSFQFCPADTSSNCPSCSTVYQCAEGEESVFCASSPEQDQDPGYWGQMNLCAQEISWGSNIATFKDASDLVRYLLLSAPFLQAEDIPASCKLAVGDTIVPGMKYGDFLTGITLGGTVKGSSVCSDPIQITIPEQADNEEEQNTSEFNRCELFPGKSYALTLLDIEPNSSALTLYIKMSGGVPGLEVDYPQDPNPWEYSAFLGSVQATSCSFPGYANRLYCTFNLPDSYMDTAQPLNVYVNRCGRTIYDNQAVSIIPLEDTSGGNGGDGGTDPNVCIKPPYPNEQEACWVWNEEKCKWECYN